MFKYKNSANKIKTVEEKIINSEELNEDIDLIFERVLGHCFCKCETISLKEKRDRLRITLKHQKNV